MRLLLCSLIVLVSFSLRAQTTGTLSGKIIDQETSEPIIGATLLIEKTTLGAITDLEGSFTIKNVPAGQQLLRIKYIGYDDTVQMVSVVAGQTVTVPTVSMQSLSVGLNAVEVFANVVEDRKTPVAASTIDAVVIEQQLGSMPLPEILNSTPGVYATQGDGTYGDAYMNIRGFSQVELLFLINGVPTNDMENGLMYWTNFAGMSDFTRSVQVQRGLGASKLALNSVGGTVNMITNPAERRKGGQMEVSMANGSYRNRYKLSLHSGEMKGGWAVSFQGSRTTGEGMRPGSFVDAWTYFMSVSKKVTDKHTLMLTAFGAPANRGRAYNSNTATYEKFNDYQYNASLGVYRGQEYNVSQNKSHKPQVTLLSNWTINDRMTLSTSAYMSIARAYGTSALRDGVSSPVTNDGYLDLDSASRMNVGNVQTIENPYGSPFGSTIQGSRSSTIIEARYNNHAWYGVISNLNFQINPTTSVVAGVDLRDYTATHYGQVFDLLGGSYWVDRDISSEDDNNLLTPNRVARKGDKIRYNYDGRVRWGALFAQLEKTINNFDIFVSANGSSTQMWRVGNYWRGGAAFMNESLGESDKRKFNNYNIKAGVNYRIDGRHNVFVNGGTFTRAPFMGNSFEDSRYSNTYMQGLTNEKIQAAEIGYSYRTSRFRANVNAYYTIWEDKALVQSYLDQVTRDQVYFSIAGQGASHKGIEIDARYELLPALELTAMGSFGDWEWTKNVNSFVTNAAGTAGGYIQVYTKGLKVGNTAQTMAYLGVNYRGLENIYIGARFNYYGNLYEDYDPLARTVENAGQVRKLPDYTVVDVYGGYNFTIGGLRARASGNIHNLLNQTFIRRSDEAFGTQELYGLPINYSGSLSVKF